jgi:hypothetical protein
MAITKSAWFPLLMSGVLAACEADDLSEQNVTSISAGDGTERVTHSFDAELLTLSCEGYCGLIELSEDEVISTCDQGARQNVELELTFDGGAATLDVRSSVYVSRLEGAAFLDGGFDVGGIRTVRGGLTPFSRFRGRVSGQGPQMPEQWVVRTAIDHVANAAPCVATYQVTRR